MYSPINNMYTFTFDNIWIMSDVPPPLDESYSLSYFCCRSHLDGRVRRGVRRPVPTHWHGTQQEGRPEHGEGHGSEQRRSDRLQRIPRGVPYRRPPAQCQRRTETYPLCRQQVEDPLTMRPRFTRMRKLGGRLDLSFGADGKSLASGSAALQRQAIVQDN